MLFSSATYTGTILLRHHCTLLPPRLRRLFPSLRFFASLPPPMDINNNVHNNTNSHARATPSSGNGRGRAFDTRNDREITRGRGGASGLGKDKIDALECEFHLKLRHSVSSYVAAATIPTSTTVSHETTNLHIHNPKPKHPQHFLSLLLHNPSHHQSLQQLHSQIITSSLFHHHPLHTDPTSLLLFNTLIRSYSLSSSPHHALHFFTSTLNSLTHPLSLDSFTFTFLSHTCAISNSSSSFGFHLHGLVFNLGFQSHVYVQTGLLRMYATWGLLVSAAEVFDEMPQRSIVTWNVFINGLIKWGQLDFARSVFDRMLIRSVVSWTLVIDGYTRVNKPLKALALFRKMVEVDGIEPNEVTLLAVFPAIASLGDIKMCRSVHGCVEKRGFNAVDIRIENALIDLYAKCGCIESASGLFWEMPEWRKNLVSWNSLISGFAIFGMVREAGETFERMEKAGVRPNHVAFLSVLSACSHGGLVEEGLKFFGKMVNDYGLVPDVKHYGCVIDMLGRAGRLEEAERVALQVPREVANDVIWRMLLGACSVHDNVEIGQRVTKKILEMEKGHGGEYVLMSNILAGVGRFKDVERLRETIDKRNAFKLPGYRTRVLRHMASELKLNMRSDGYVNVNDLLKLNLKTLANIPLRSHTIDDIREAVRKDNKQRFSLIEENGELLIRANQGHTTTAVETESLLKPILSAEEFPVCVHGTYRRNLDSILSSGLKRMKRLHVHFSCGLPTDGEVISGMRRDVNVLIFLDVRKALEEGIKLYISDNKVILTEGFDGVVPSKYFLKIESWPERKPIPF